ncbi:MAG: ORF6N domain-containing protein [Armatimonadetes bacterium]|nr:ORF6N domain-containing protein [Armatimonadota bacterium]
MVWGQRTILDRDLAQLYGVETRVLDQAVRRNIDRFPEDFMFSLTREEIRNISQFVICSGLKHARSVNAFTEQGVAMLSTVLNSPRAVRVNIEIMRAFVRPRRMLVSNLELAHRFDELEKKNDARFKVVFDAIRQLMTPPEPARRIAYRVKESRAKYKVAGCEDTRREKAGVGDKSK